MDVNEVEQSVVEHKYWEVEVKSDLRKSIKITEQQTVDYPSKQNEPLDAQEVVNKENKQNPSE